MGRLFIRNIEIPLMAELSMSANYAIADIRNPEKRNTDFTKTVTVPAVKEINDLFQHIYDPDSILSTFNPNKKESCVYFTEDNEVLRGDVQLVRCNVDKETGAGYYQLNIFGRNANVFNAIGNKFLTGNTSSGDDLDFSTYDHLLSRTNVTNSWATSNKVAGVDTALVAGIGYRYGLIDYGKNNGDLANFYVKDLRPQIFVHEIVKKIVEDAGYTIGGAFATGAFFKTIALPSTEENILLSSSTIANSQFYARRNATQSLTTNTIGIPFSSWSSSAYFPRDTILFNEDNVAPYNDAGGIYGTGTGYFIPPLTKVYNITAIINYDIVLTNDVGTATNAVLTSCNVSVLISRYDGVNWIPLVSNVNNTANVVMPTLTLTGQQVSVSLNFACTAGEVYKVEVQQGFILFNLFTAGAVAVTTGNTTCQLLCKTDSQFYASLQDTNITEGATLQVNQVLPKKVYQKDFLRDIIKTFNLYLEPSKTVENQIVIEPYDAFFTGTTKDWTRLRDISKGEVVSPMGILDAKIYKVQWKKDEDYWNKLYYDNYKESYGSFRFDVDNDWVRNENVTEVMFSPTPLVGSTLNGLIIPKFWKQDSNQIKGLKVNPRLLIWGGVINMTFGSWTLKSASGDVTYNSFPSVGHLDNVYNPTFDLNFDNPKAVYYTSPNLIYNDNNLGNVYLKGQLNQITNKQSKVISRWYNITSLDIKELTFRSKIFDEGQYYLINQIKNFDTSIESTTEVELLLLTNYSPHVVNSVELEPNENPIETARQLSVRSVIEEESNTSSGYRLTAPLAPVTSEVITSDTLLNTSYNNKTIYVDANSNDIYLTWDCTTMSDINVTLIRIDSSANKIYINDVDATVTVIGVSVPYDTGMVQYDPLTITSVIIAGLSNTIYLK